LARPEAANKKQTSNLRKVCIFLSKLLNKSVLLSDGSNANITARLVASLRMIGFK
jgi:hypothetical protein